MLYYPETDIALIAQAEGKGVFNIANDYHSLITADLLKTISDAGAGTLSAPIKTDINTLRAYNWTSGDIVISEIGCYALEDQSKNDITLLEVINRGGDVKVNTHFGRIFVGLVDAEDFDVTLHSHQAGIADLEYKLGIEDTIDIIAKNLYINAADGPAHPIGYIGIGSPNPDNPLETYAIETRVSTMSLINQGGGDIYVINEGDLLLTHASHGVIGGTLNVFTDGHMTVNHAQTQCGHINLIAEDGLTIAGNIKSTGGDIFLDADFSMDGAKEHYTEAASFIQLAG